MLILLQILEDNERKDTQSNCMLLQTIKQELLEKAQIGFRMKKSSRVAAEWMKTDWKKNIRNPFKKNLVLNAMEILLPLELSYFNNVLCTDRSSLIKRDFSLWIFEAIIIFLWTLFLQVPPSMVLPQMISWPSCDTNIERMKGRGHFGLNSSYLLLMPLRIQS